MEAFPEKFLKTRILKDDIEINDNKILVVTVENICKYIIQKKN